MSIRVMTAIWQHAQVSGGALIVLLAMGDWANDDGTGVYAKQATLATKARLSDRQVRNVLGALEEAEYIYRDGKHGHTVLWRVENDPAIIASRKPISGSTGSELPTEPLKEPSGSETSSDPSSAGTDEDDGASSFAGADKYAAPKTIGAKAAPWLVLELGRLMRENDEKVRVPAGVRVPLKVWVLPDMDGRRQPTDARTVFDVAGWKASAKPWLDAMRLLIDTDERAAQEVVKVLRWCQLDSFWKTNVLSAPKFREQYDKLRARWDEEGGAGGTRAGRPPSTGPSASQMDRMAGRAA
jgi:hypothetical protein